MKLKWSRPWVVGVTAVLTLSLTVGPGPAHADEPAPTTAVTSVAAVPVAAEPAAESSSTTSSTTPSTTPSTTSSTSSSATTTAATRPRHSATGSGSSTSGGPSTPWTGPPTGTTPPVDGGDPVLGAAELAAQVAQANALLAALAASSTELAALVTSLDANAKTSNALLDRLATAREKQAGAQAEADDNQARSTLLGAQLAMARQQLRDWAFYAYTDGGSVAEMAGVLDAMQSDPAKAGNPVGDMVYLTDERARALTAVDALTAAQDEATRLARAASDRATKAAEEITAAKAALDTTVTRQKAELAALKAEHAKELSSAGPIVAILVGARTPEATAAYDALLAEIDKAGPDDGVVGAACSHDETAYPNGTIPPAGLCPLWKAPGEMLRPRAAAAFNALSQAYAKATGTPICVTDSYRTLAEQYAVKAARGMWAATPGTSPHGRGIALDLCGGINSFGTPAHLWMRQNAPLYGWYHPAWAEPGGSLPEPWHWEFAG